jgi:hypothetical protein
MPSPTLAEIRAKGGYIYFQCRRCREIGAPPMEDLAKRFGWDVTIEWLDGRPRCPRANHYVAGPCGGRGGVWLTLPTIYGDGLARSC